MLQEAVKVSLREYFKEDDLKEDRGRAGRTKSKQA